MRAQVDQIEEVIVNLKGVSGSIVRLLESLDRQAQNMRVAALSDGMAGRGAASNA